jgi:CheY-like chemotaxis protein
MDTEAYNWISRRAHELWQNEGHPNGRDRAHWSQAVDEWRNKTALDTVPADHVHTVLVVDDEPLIRFSTVEALEEAGFEVFEAVFTDVNMPGSTDGLGLTQRVRAAYPRTRVIVTSGHVRLGAFDLASGVSFLPKPYAHNSVVDLLSAPAGTSQKPVAKN